MGELANCKNCNGLFVKATRDLCPDCVKKEEKDFQTVYDFLKKRQNRTASIPQIVEATEVDEYLIMKFVKEKRLRPSQFPNLSYPCQKCGKGITEGTICGTCSKELVSDLHEQDKLDQIAQKNKEADKKMNTYYSVNKSK